MDLDAQIDRVINQKVRGAVKLGLQNIARETFKTLTTEAASPGSAIGAPIWSGEFLGSERVALNHTDVSSLDPAPGSILDQKDFYTPVPTGVQQSQFEEVLQSVKSGDKIVFSDSARDAAGVESGRFSPKTPQGVYGITAEYIKAHFRVFSSQK